MAKGQKEVVTAADVGQLTVASDGTPRIAEGAGSATRRGSTGGGKVIELAMAQAVQDCTDAGITDPALIKTAMAAARAKVKELFAVEAAKEAEHQKALAEGRLSPKE